MSVTVQQQQQRQQFQGGTICRVHLRGLAITLPLRAPSGTDPPAAATAAARPSLV